MGSTSNNALACPVNFYFKKNFFTLPFLLNGNIESDFALRFHALIELYLRYQNVRKHYFLAGSFLVLIILINYTRL